MTELEGMGEDGWDAGLEGAGSKKFLKSLPIQKAAWIYLRSIQYLQWLPKILLKKLIRQQCGVSRSFHYTDPVPAAPSARVKAHTTLRFPNFPVVVGNK